MPRCAADDQCGILDSDEQIDHTLIVSVGVQVGGNKLGNRGVADVVKAVMIPLHGSGVRVLRHEIVPSNS